MIGISEWWWEWVLKVCSFLVLVSLSRWLSRFYLKSYLVHILLENKIHPIRLLECAKAFPACRGSLTKSLLPFSSTFPLPLARSQIFPSRLSAFVFVRVCVCHWPGLISLMATRLSLCLSICQICQYATFVNMPGLLICHICWYATFVNLPRLSVVTQALLTLLAWAVPQWRQLQLLMAAIALLLVLFFNFLHL